MDPREYEVALKLLTAAVEADARHESRLPHLVVSHNVTSDRREHYGPFPDAVQAAAVAAAIEAEVLAEFWDQVHKVSVVPLLSWPDPAVSTSPGPRTVP